MFPLITGGFIEGERGGGMDVTQGITNAQADARQFTGLKTLRVLVSRIRSVCARLHSNVVRENRANHLESARNQHKSQVRSLGWCELRSRTLVGAVSGQEDGFRQLQAHFQRWRDFSAQQERDLSNCLDACTDAGAVAVTLISEMRTFFGRLLEDLADLHQQLKAEDQMFDEECRDG